MAKIDEHIKVMMLKGEPGSNIKSIEKTATSGLVDTYTVTLTDKSTNNFNVTNGSSIQSIAKTGTSGLVDTYTVTLTNGETTNFTVKNGRDGIDGKDGKDGADFDTFEIGGRNLYTGTRDFSGSDWENIDQWTKEDEKYNGFTVYSKSIYWNGLCQFLDAKSGESYVFSGYFKAETGSSIYAYLDRNSKVSSPDNAMIGLSNEDLTTWRRFSVTFTVVSDGVIAPRIENKITDKKLYVCGLKLERSTKPSDWTPAPEDKADVSALAVGDFVAHINEVFRIEDIVTKKTGKMRFLSFSVLPIPAIGGGNKAWHEILTVDEADRPSSINRFVSILYDGTTYKPVESYIDRKGSIKLYMSFTEYSYFRGQLVWFVD